MRQAPLQTAATTTERDPRWKAVLARDAGADGRFVYSVKTTGVYCRPSCASRLARPENVRFHETPDAAKQAGFRPCLRCRPDASSQSEQQAARVAAACRVIEQSESAPVLAVLARQAGLSPFHFHRLFKTHTGLTPRAYAAAVRERRLQAQLPGSDSVTGAVLDAGYATQARFYEQAGQVLGMKPGTYRAGGADTRIRFAVAECSLGSILVAQSALGLCAILLGDDPELLVRDLQDRFPKAELQAGDAGFDALVATVVGFVEAPQLGLDLPLDIRGTAFQQRVWKALQQIPVGSTLSYSELAQRIDRPSATRAVASACAANALAVVIPCHRIIRQDGVISGYRWGVERKQALLQREARSPGGALSR